MMQERSDLDAVKKDSAQEQQTRRFPLLLLLRQDSFHDGQITWGSHRKVVKWT